MTIGRFDASASPPHAAAARPKAAQRLVCHVESRARMIGIYSKHRAAQPVTAPNSAGETSFAYFASTPLV
jgi:hypothetical protein